MTEDGMPPHRAGAGDTITFFTATLVLWAISVGFEIGVRGHRELAAVAAGFAFFQAANSAIRAALRQHHLPAPPLPPHFGLSYLCSVVPMAYKGHENMFQHEELVGSSWIGAYSALCFSCGHVAYGQLDMLRYRLYSGWIPGILLHHLILLICFTLALYRNVTINYLILTLLCEVLQCSFQSLLTMNHHQSPLHPSDFPRTFKFDSDADLTRTILVLNLLNLHSHIVSQKWSGHEAFSTSTDHIQRSYYLLVCAADMNFIHVVIGARCISVVDCWSCLCQLSWLGFWIRNSALDVTSQTPSRCQTLKTSKSSALN